MTIHLNGEPFALTGPGPVTVSSLLDLLELDARRVAVERNRIVVRRETYGSTGVTDRDEIEIVNLVGGG
ncbi:MAG: sulfur carrier protein ThiS [Vicinamibacterales bacterium]